MGVRTALAALGAAALAPGRANAAWHAAASPLAALGAAALALGRPSAAWHAAASPFAALGAAALALGRPSAAWRAAASPLAVLGAAALALGGAACGGEESASEEPPAGPSRVEVDGRRFRDALGRELILRGYNAKVAPLFDVTFDDGRAPNEVFPAFDAAAAARYEELGFNVLRLPVSWSALEPEPKRYARAFFDALGETMRLAREHHFYLVIDLHQDAYSKEIGQDGAPLWAIVPAPTKLLEGPYDDARRLSPEVLQAGFNFFANAPAADGRPLQEAFVDAVKQIVKYVRRDPVVLGYEAFNEPVVLSTSELDAFHERFAAGVHAVDPSAPVFFEPIGTRNQTDQARIPAEPWAAGSGVYAPHIYTGWFSRPSQNDWESEDPAALEPSMLAAEAEAEAWGAPLFIGEFGCDQTMARGPKWLEAELDLQDRLLTSSTAWVWAETGLWGLRDGENQERAATARIVARPFPRAVAGDLIALERPAPGRLVVRYRVTRAARGRAHEVSLSRASVTGVTISCDGAPVEYESAPGRATFTCPDASEGEHAFELAGSPVE
ncbi:MAG: cellulase family glycosylhydrolase [Sorangiineae bacterium]|nr:cellulase family glycosylhydrolase [Polyangiaceae bacterium]MEB2323527.1 cellulase family glycosylhydrolase [Sorangiineae bacterium]